MLKDNWFEYATPESQGIPSAAILSFIEELEKERIGIDGLIVMRHEKIVAEGYWAPFEKGDPHRMFSSAKAVVAMAVMIAIDEGLLSLEDPVTKFFEGDMPEGCSERFERMTVYDMLTMHTGHAKDPLSIMVMNGGDREETFFNYAPEYEPGTHFMYNNGVPDMLGIILYRLTGKRVLEYLEEKMFRPMEMDGMNAQRYRHLDELPTMTSSTRSLLKMAYLIMNHGMWNGRQIISRRLADMAGSYLVPSLQDPIPNLMAYDTQFGYGFQIWRNSVGGFRIDGGRGQFGIAIPELELVIAINATEQDQGVLPIMVWKHITNKLFARPIKEEPEAYGLLMDKLQHLTWAEDGGTVLSDEICGQYRLRESFYGTDSVTVSKGGNSEILISTDRGNNISFGAVNSRQWKEIPEIFAFEEQRYRFGLSRNGIAGGDGRLFGCAVCREDGILELHIRGKSFMGCRIIVIDPSGGSISYIPYDDMARKYRSAEVKHPDLDRLMKSGTVTVGIVKE